MAKRVLHDRFFKQAKREGYLARSAYKLIEIDDRRRVIHRAGKVLDLGCAPGSWLQVLAERTGNKGTVVGIDLKPVTHPMPEHVYTVEGDFTTIEPEHLLGGDGKLFDGVFSDMAPNTSGAGDDFLSARLCEEIVDRLPDLLRKGGHCVMKILEGGGTPELLKRCKKCFAEAKTYKPAATREVSRETYIIGQRYRPPAKPTGAPTNDGKRGDLDGWR